MTGQAKQTEVRCEVIPGAGQRRMRTQGRSVKEGCRTERKGKEETNLRSRWGGERVKDGREER